MMHERNYDLVISEWFMEPVSGLQLLKFVRAETSFLNLRFLMSVPASEEVVLASREAGADALLVEPYSLESIANTIRSAL
jgi:two-component system chemotaxis response regulator CheY